MFKKWIKQAEKQGWQQKKIKSGILLIPPQGDPVALHLNHSRTETRNMINYKVKLRRAGLDI